MTIKPVLAVFAGFISWWAAFYGSTALFAALWPALIESGRSAIQGNDWSHITTPMLLLLLSMYLWVSPLAGWVTARISENRKLVGITIIPLFAYAAWAHFYNLWGLLPDWYKLIVPVIIPPLVYAGGLLVKSAKQIA
jgi:hypothetical protein